MTDFVMHQGRVYCDSPDDAAMAVREIVGDDATLTITGPTPDGGYNYHAIQPATSEVETP